MTAVTIQLDPATDSVLRDRAAAENMTIEMWIARLMQEVVDLAAERLLDPVWTPEAVAAVHAAEAELASGGGVPHAEVKRRTQAMLGR